MIAKCNFGIITLAGTDYSEIGVQTVSFADGAKNGAIVNARLTILNDMTVEGIETIVIVGYTPAGLKASFAPGHDSAILTIYDNDGK